jgi:hypothetical protein
MPREYRDQIHFFDTNGDLDEVITMPTDGIQYLPGTVGAGYMDVKWIDSTHAVTCASLEGKIYLVMPFENPPYEVALDIAGAINDGINTFSGTSIRINKAKTRIIATYGLRYVVLLSIDSNYNIRVVDSVDMCSQSSLASLCAMKDNLGPYGGVHYGRLTSDEDRLVITSYYGGYPSIKRVHSFAINSDFNSLAYDATFNPNMDGGNPHGVVYAEWITEPAPDTPSSSAYGGPCAWVFSGLLLLASLVH